MRQTESSGAPSTDTHADRPRPLVSVVIATYNYGHFIAQTLESVFAQTYQNLECVIVDDGSTDDTPEVVGAIAETDPRVRYFRQTNQGHPAALNTGFRNIRGDYVQILDADDLLEPRKLELHVAYLESNPDTDIVYGAVRYFRGENVGERLFSMWEPNEPWMPEVAGGGAQVLPELVRGNIMTINAPLLRRRLVETVGLFDETLPGTHDWDYWLRCAAAGARFAYMDAAGTLALVRSHPSSLSKNALRMLSLALLLRKKLVTLLGDPELLELNRRLTAEVELDIRNEQVRRAVEYGERGERAKSAKLFARIGLERRSARESVKFLFCALAGLIAPRGVLANVVAAPARKTVVDVLRGPFRGSTRLKSRETEGADFPKR